MVEVAKYQPPTQADLESEARRVLKLRGKDATAWANRVRSDAEALITSGYGTAQAWAEARSSALLGHPHD